MTGLSRDENRDDARVTAGPPISADTPGAARRAATRASALARRGVGDVRALQVLRRAGLIDPRPSQAAADLRAIRTYRQLGAPLGLAAHRHPERTGLIDELGSLTFAEMDQRAESLAAALACGGITDDDCVAILCTNHRGFIDISFAAAKLGARILYLSTGLDAAQLRDICRREAVTLLVHDQEFTGLTENLALSRGTVLAWHDRRHGDLGTLDNLIRDGAGLPPVGPPPRHARVVLTSGGTDASTGAVRTASPSPTPVAGMLSRVPYRAAAPTYLAPPMYHAFGYSQMQVSISLGCTLIVERSFSPQRVAAAVTAHRPSSLVLAPVMLRRLLGELEQSLNRYDLSSLAVVLVPGAALDLELVRRAQVSLGPVLYNVYGSTEAAYAAVATPEDLRVAPGCAGRPPLGTVVRLYDGDDRRIREADQVGRIFVRSSFAGDACPGGGTTAEIDGLLSTGDVGHLDSDGRLWVDGCADNVIVWDAENRLPGEVERLSHGQSGRRGAEQVREFVRARLARLTGSRDVSIFDELPRTPAGKVPKRTLGDLHKADPLTG